MACVNACPDTALFATVVPEADLAAAMAPLRRRGADRGRAADGPRGAVRPDDEVRRGPERNGLEPAKFGIFVDPTHCKGCAECVEVCAALGHDALRMTDKVAGERERPLDDRPGRARHALLPVAAADAGAYRNEKALADLMLGEHAFGYVGGAGSCAGCGEATAIRMMVAATRQVHGPESMGIVAATGCNSVYGSTYPFNPYLVPWTNSLFENAPADALGIRARWDQAGHRRPAALGPRRRRRHVRHRLPVALAHGRVGRRHQGARPRHAGLLEHRRPGVDRHRSAAR